MTESPTAPPPTPRRHAFTGLDLWTLVEQRARSHGDRPFLVWEPFEGPARILTYGELRYRAASVAGGLFAMGVRAGDAVLVHLENCPEFVLAWFACARAGAVAVSTNTRSAPAELAYYADDCGAVGAITQPSLLPAVTAAAAGLGWVAVTDHDAGALPRQGDAPDRVSSFASLEAAEPPRREPDASAAAGVQYTSGTTSRPKGVVWTHANALWAARTNAAHEGLRPDDVHYVYLPLFHTNALAYSLLATLWAGCSAVLQPRWSTSRFWEVSVRRRCTWTSLIWFSQRALAGVDVPPDHSYRVWGCAGFEAGEQQRARVHFLPWWGMTETLTQGILGDATIPNTPRTIGRAAPEYQVRAAREDGADCEAGEPGSLLVKGVPGLSLFAGYLGRPEDTAGAYDDDGWFVTGDVVRPRTDGQFEFVDRAKDVLRVGGENVAASEVERVVRSVDGVEEAAVVGRPHRMLEQEPVVFVIASAVDTDLERRILERCRAELADFKVPRAVRVVDDLPRAVLQKIDKRALREILSDERHGAAG